MYSIICSKGSLFLVTKAAVTSCYDETGNKITCDPGSIFCTVFIRKILSFIWC